MTLPEGLVMGCQEEDLNEAQVLQYANAVKEYDKAMAEVNQLKKGAITFHIFICKSLVYSTICTTSIL